MVFGSSFLLLNQIQNKPTNGAKKMMKNAPPEFQTKYLGKRIPEKFRKKGASNPVKYSWKAKD